MRKERLKKFVLLLFLLPAFCMCSQPEKRQTALLNTSIQLSDQEDMDMFLWSKCPFWGSTTWAKQYFKGWDWCSGYHYSDSIIIGFSHTHLSGTGGSDLGDILLMPVNGKVSVKRGHQDDISNAYASYFSHDNEEVKAGYYSVILDKYKIKAELTATERVGVHKYTFPTENDNHVVIDLKEGNGDKSTDTYLKRVDAHTIEGYRFSKGWAKDQRIWFTLKSNQEIEKLEVYDDTTPAGENVIKAKGAKGVISFAGNPKK